MFIYSVFVMFLFAVYVSPKQVRVLGLKFKVLVDFIHFIAVGWYIVSVFSYIFIFRLAYMVLIAVF